MSEPLYARAELPIDLEALRAFCATELPHRPQAYQGSGRYFGGWSITSGSGDYRDGWQQGQQAMRGTQGSGRAEIDWQKYRKLFPVPPREMRTPTELFHGPVKALLENIEERCRPTGVTPSRARLSKLDPRRKLTFH